mmetsp:Transcript_1222/g.1995  ORF Transcript_1222/g.1995 Transcript_1222/m.1995 type:complete len:658 (+) Transcript_1222:44-2017(+)
MDISDLSSVEYLELAVSGVEAVVQSQTLSCRQIAKLYGFTEKLQLNHIDQLHGDHVKPVRKGFVDRTNRILDLLEERNNSSAAADSGQSSTYTGIVHSDRLYSCVTLESGGHIKLPRKVCDIHQPSLSITSTMLRLMDDGLLDSCPSSVHVFSEDCTVFTKSRVSSEIRSENRFGEAHCRIEHIHAAAALALYNMLASGGIEPGFHLILSLYLSGISCSLVEIGNSVDFLWKHFTHIVVKDRAHVKYFRSPHDVVSRLVHECSVPAGEVGGIWFVGEARNELAEWLGGATREVCNVTPVSQYILPQMGCLDEGVRMCANAVSSYTPLLCSTVGIRGMCIVEGTDLDCSTPAVTSIPFLLPCCSIPGSVTRRLSCSLPAVSSSPIEVAMEVTECVPGEYGAYRTLLSLAVQLPQTTGEDDGEICVELDVELSISLERDVRVAVRAVKENSSSEWPLTANTEGNGEQRTVLSSGWGLRVMQRNSSYTEYGDVLDTGWKSVEIAKEYKAKGNAFMAQSDHYSAIEMYSLAIAADCSNGILYSNRSAAYSHLSLLRAALSDAEECVRLMPQWEKGWARHGGALFRLGRIEEALGSYRRAKELSPESETIQLAYKEVHDSWVMRKAEEEAHRAKQMEKESKRKEEEDQASKANCRDNSCCMS